MSLERGHGRKFRSWRFGLHGYKISTLEEVGNEIGVTRERVRQIQMDALKHLREILESEGFYSDALVG